jgi:RNAse (barnase) inhibitor barstar
VTIDLIALQPGVSEMRVEDSEIDNARLAAASQVSDVAIRVLRGHRMKDMCSVFEEFDAVFQLPSYFGKNWAALDECMNDADWFPLASRVIVLVMESEQIFAREADREAAVDTLHIFFQRLSADWGRGTNGRTVKVSVLLRIASAPTTTS